MASYGDGDVVWVKFGSNWWPAEVTGENRLPEAIVKELKALKRKPFCVVKFLNENTYENVKSAKLIFQYNCEKKEEFKKKGMALFESGKSFMETFPAAVEKAEKLSKKPDAYNQHQSDSIVQAVLGQTTSRNVRDLSALSTQRRDSVTRIMNLTPQNTSSRPSVVGSAGLSRLSISSPATPSRSNSISSDLNLYRCNLCEFTSLRQNVMILHRKNHSTGNSIVRTLNVPTKAPVAAQSSTAVVQSTFGNWAKQPQQQQQQLPVKVIKSILKRSPAAQPSLNIPAATTDKINQKPSARSPRNLNTSLSRARSPSPLPSKETTKALVKTSRSRGRPAKARRSLRSTPHPETIALTVNTETEDEDDDGMSSVTLATNASSAKTSSSSPKRNSEELRKQLLADWSDEDKEEDKVDEVIDKKPIMEATGPVVNSTMKMQEPETERVSPTAEVKLVDLSLGEAPQSTNQTVAKRIRNIPKKDRRDIVLKEFTSDLTIGNTAATMAGCIEADPPIVSIDCANSNSSDSVVVVGIVPPQFNETKHDDVPLDAEQSSFNTLKSDCFDFQEDEDNEGDVLTSIANFKKKYLSPDKLHAVSSETAAGIEAPDEKSSEDLKVSPQAEQDLVAQKDDQLAADIENLLLQTSTTIVDVSTVTETTNTTASNSFKDDLNVKGLPIKERGKRIFKSRNRSRQEEESNVVTSSNEEFNAKDNGAVELAFEAHGGNRGKELLGGSGLIQSSRNLIDAPNEVNVDLSSPVKCEGSDILPKTSEISSTQQELAPQKDENDTEISTENGELQRMETVDEQHTVDNAVVKLEENGDLHIGQALLIKDIEVQSVEIAASSDYTVGINKDLKIPENEERKRNSTEVELTENEGRIVEMACDEAVLSDALDAVTDDLNAQSHKEARDVGLIHVKNNDDGLGATENSADSRIVAEQDEQTEVLNVKATAIVETAIAEAKSVHEELHEVAEETQIGENATTSVADHLAPVESSELEDIPHEASKSLGLVEITASAAIIPLEAVPSLENSNENNEEPAAAQVEADAADLSEAAVSEQPKSGHKVAENDDEEINATAKTAVDTLREAVGGILNARKLSDDAQHVDFMTEAELKQTAEEVLQEFKENPEMSRLTPPTDENSSLGGISEAGAEFGSPIYMLEEERLPTSVVEAANEKEREVIEKVNGQAHNIIATNPMPHKLGANEVEVEALGEDNNSNQLFIDDREDSVDTKNEAPQQLVKEEENVPEEQNNKDELLNKVLVQPEIEEATKEENNDKEHVEDSTGEQEEPATIEEQLQMSDGMDELPKSETEDRNKNDASDAERNMNQAHIGYQEAEESIKERDKKDETNTKVEEEPNEGASHGIEHNHVHELIDELLKSEPENENATQAEEIYEIPAKEESTNPEECPIPEAIEASEDIEQQELAEECATHQLLETQEEEIESPQIEALSGDEFEREFERIKDSKRRKKKHKNRAELKAVSLASEENVGPSELESHAAVTNEAMEGPNTAEETNVCCEETNTAAANSSGLLVDITGTEGNIALTLSFTEPVDALSEIKEDPSILEQTKSEDENEKEEEEPALKAINEELEETKEDPASLHDVNKEEADEHKQVQAATVENKQEPVEIIPADEHNLQSCAFDEKQEAPLLSDEHKEQTITFALSKPTRKRRSCMKITPRRETTETCSANAEIISESKVRKLDAMGEEELMELEAAPSHNNNAGTEVHQMHQTVSKTDNEVPNSTPSPTQNSLKSVAPSLSEIRSFRPQRKNAPSATESPPERTPSPKSSPIEKVRINVDVANPLSSQIANILACSNNQQILQQQQQQHQTSTAAAHKKANKLSPNALSLPLKRKKSIEEEIPSFIIERHAGPAPTTEALEKEAISQLQNLCPQVKITRKDKVAVQESDATEAATAMATPKVTQLLHVPDQEVQQTLGSSVATSPPSHSSHLFDINAMFLQTGNEQLMGENVQLLLTQPFVATNQQAPPANKRKGPRKQEGRRNVNVEQPQQQLFQLQNIIQAQQTQQQLGIDQRGNKYLIIKSPSSDVLVQQSPVQQLPKPQTACFSLGSSVTLHTLNEPVKPSTVSPPQSQVQQQGPSPTKPKSPAAAATGGRKQAGNTIALPSPTAVKQTQQKFVTDLQKASNLNRKQTNQAKNRRKSQQQQQQLVLQNSETQRNSTATAANMLGQNRRLSDPNLQQKPAPGKVLDAGGLAIVQQQLLQLQSQQRRKSETPPPLHHLHNRKPRKQPQQHRGLHKKLGETTTAPPLPPPQQQIDVQQTLRTQQIASQPQQQQAPQPQPEQSSAFNEEQLNQIQAEDQPMDGTPRILAVPAEPMPGYNETFLLCTLEDNVYKAIDNIPLYLDRDLNQLVPVPTAGLDREPSLLSNQPQQQQRMQQQQMPNVLKTPVESDAAVQMFGVESAAEDDADALNQQALLEESTGDEGEQQMASYMPPENGSAIITIEGQDVILEAATVAHLLANPDTTQLVTDDGTEFIIPRDVLAALEAQHLQAVNAAKINEQPVASQINPAAGPTDILAVALAGSDLYGSDLLEIETSQGLPGLLGTDGGIVFQPGAHLTPPITAHTSETSTLLNQTPIMSTLEKPSTACTSSSAACSVTTPALSLGRHNLDDSLAVIGVSTAPSTVPTSLELPITVTNPEIATKVTMAASHTDMVQFQPPRTNVSSETRHFNDPGS